MNQKIEFVELGLPSKTLWAKINFGAETEYECGILSPLNEIGDLPGNVSLPTYNQYAELIQHCQFSLVFIENQQGQMFTCIEAKGPNGNRIHFPTSTEFNETLGGRAVCCWSSSNFGNTMAGFFLVQISEGIIPILQEISNITIGVAAITEPRMFRFVMTPEGE